MDKYESVKSEILRSGGKVGKNASAFKILYALMKSKGYTSMHHSRSYIAKCNRLKSGRIDSLSKETIYRYMETGELLPPIEFLHLPRS